MTKDQSNVYKMYLATQGCLDENSLIWSSVPKVVVYKNELDELIARIVEKATASSNVPSVKERKEQLKRVLALRVSALSGVLQAYASETDNADLEKAIKYTKSEILLLKDTEINAVVIKCTGKARELVEILPDYGIAEAMLSEIETSLEEFNGLLGKPRTILNQKYVNLDTVKDLFDETDILIKKRLDKIMLMFRESQLEFYNSYGRARAIVDN